MSRQHDDRYLRQRPDVAQNCLGTRTYLRNQGKALATVEQHAGMWRIRMPDGWVSDMANLSWAKEGAIRSVLSLLNRKETPAEAPSSRSNGAEAA